MAEAPLQSREAFTPRWKTATRSFFFGLGFNLFLLGVIGPVLTIFPYFASDDAKFVDLVSIWSVCLLSFLLSLLALRLTRSPGLPRD
jgi:hypothetical protein